MYKYGDIYKFESVNFLERIVYLDNSATTKPCKKACEYINNALDENWGNPSSLHMLGINAEILMNEARSCIADKISAGSDEIIFTASGTEANNTAVFSAKKSRNRKVVTTVLEHPSVLEPVKRLEEEGFEVVRLGTDNQGVIKLDELEQLVDEKTALVSVMLVNNEIGSIQPIAEAVKLVRKKSPNTLFHCDAVQAFGKIPINVKKLGIDLLSASAHKIHGPKGIGFLYCRKGVKIPAFINGGGQERGMRSGTESVPLIAGFMGAVKELPPDKDGLQKINELNCYAREKLGECEFVKINSPISALPYILNISLPSYRSETLLHFLENKGIYVSSGSACAKGEASYVLKALGLSRSDADSALRLSFSRYTTKEDIDLTVAALTQAVAQLRRSKI